MNEERAMGTLHLIALFRDHQLVTASLFTAVAAVQIFNMQMKQNQLNRSVLRSKFAEHEGI